MATLVRVNPPGQKNTWLDPADHPRTIAGAAVWLKINYNGTRKSIRIGDDSPAIRAEAKKQAAVIAGKLAAKDLSPLDPRPKFELKGDPLFRTAATEWLEVYPKSFPRRSSTMKNYQSTIDARLLPAFGDRRVSQISRQAIQDWIATTRSEKDPTTGKILAYSTLVSHVVPTFRMIMAFAEERAWIPVSPFKVGGKLFAPSDADEEAMATADPFSPKEMTLILGAARQIAPDLELLLRLWSQCGARSGEVRGLLVSDLDLKAGEVSITKSLQPNGKLGPVKNRRGKRAASLLACAVATDQPPEKLLKDLVRHCRGKQPTDYVFTSPRTGGPVSPGSLKPRWARALDLAGVTFRTPETLRHTHVSTALSAGEHPLAVAERCGHSPQIMLTHYTKLVPASAHKPSASRLRRAS
jgi:integrase